MIKTQNLQDNIIAVFGLQDLPDQKKIAILEKMSDLVQKRIGLRILEKMNTAEQNEFIEATSANDEVKVSEMLEKKKIDMLALVQEEVSRLKEEMVGVVGGI